VPPGGLARAGGGVISQARAVGSPERLADTAGFLLARAGGRAIRELNRALEPYRLRSRHYTVLALAAEHGGLSQRELGEALAVDPSAIVALVDDLEGPAWCAGSCGTATGGPAWWWLPRMEEACWSRPGRWPRGSTTTCSPRSASKSGKT
jgi:hypothetical protein